MRPSIKLHDRVRFRRDGEVGEINRHNYTKSTMNETFIVTKLSDVSITAKRIWTDDEDFNVCGSPLLFNICNDFSDITEGDRVEMEDGSLYDVTYVDDYEFAIGRDFRYDKNGITRESPPQLNILRITRKGFKDCWKCYECGVVDSRKEHLQGCSRGLKKPKRLLDGAKEEDIVKIRYFDHLDHSKEISTEYQQISTVFDDHIRLKGKMFDYDLDGNCLPIEERDTHEIISYESIALKGSVKRAKQEMILGNKISSDLYPPNTYLFLDCNLVVFMSNGIKGKAWPISEWGDDDTKDSGWQIYKTPIVDCDNCNIKCIKQDPKIDHCVDYEPQPVETSKIKEVDGQKFLMSEPEPLTPESKFPCLVRYVNDNNHSKVCSGISHNGGVLLNDVPIPLYKFPKFEIVGYPIDPVEIDADPDNPRTFDIHINSRNWKDLSKGYSKLSIEKVREIEKIINSDLPSQVEKQDWVDYEDIDVIPKSEVSISRDQ